MCQRYGMETVLNETCLGDATLHNKEVWIVNVKLDALEECLNRLLLGLVAIEKVS